MKPWSVLGSHFGWYHRWYHEGLVISAVISSILDVTCVKKAFNLLW